MRFSSPSHRSRAHRFHGHSIGIFYSPSEKQKLVDRRATLQDNLPLTAARRAHDIMHHVPSVSRRAFEKKV
jgi:hypothetical protein